MDWNWFGTQENNNEMKRKFNEVLKELVDSSKTLHKNPDAWVNYWPTKEYLQNQTFLRSVEKGAKLRHINTSYYGYWPTDEFLILKDLRNFDKHTLIKAKPVDKRTFLDRLKNTLDLSVVNTRVKNTGLDPGYSITDTEYAQAFNGLVMYKWRQNLARTCRLNIGLVAFAVIMSTTSE